MNNRIIIIIVILTLVVGGSFIANQQSKKVEETQIADEKKAIIQNENGLLDVSGTGTPEQEIEKKNNLNSLRYVEYSKQIYNQAVNQRRVLYFYASWCSTCRPADADFKKNSSKIPEDMIVIRVNYNDPDTDQEEKDLAKKYGIFYQHTFVQIDAQGKQVAKWSGGQTEELLTNSK